MWNSSLERKPSQSGKYQTQCFLKGSNLTVGPTKIQHASIHNWKDNLLALPMNYN